MSEIEREKLGKELAELEAEHRELDNILEEIEVSPINQIKIQRLKKRKLFIKDQINLVKSELYPNIIA